MLKICSLYPKKLWVTIMYYDPACSADVPGSEPWAEAGWWSLLPGQCKIVFGADLEDINRYFLYYAQATDGAVWAGPYKRKITTDAFTFCTGVGYSPGKNFTAWYRLLDIEDYDDFTLTLIP